MINGIGKSGTGRIELPKAAAGQSATSAVAPSGAASGERSGGIGSVVSELVGMGAPVDGGKVAAIRQAIAEGRYTVDPDAIAERMIAADLS